MSREDSLALAERMKGQVWGTKVNDLLTDQGVGIIRKLRKFGEVMADGKFHDIPSTVRSHVRRCFRAGSALVTVHASGGIAMMRAAVEEAKKHEEEILAITVLTSLNEEDCQLTYGCSVKAAVLKFARWAALAGVHGIVCSPRELEILNSYPEIASLFPVTPGIRDEDSPPDDQKRTATPTEAIRWSGNSRHKLVIGRLITKDKDPVAKAQQINQQVAVARKELKS